MAKDTLHYRSLASVYMHKKLDAPVWNARRGTIFATFKPQNLGGIAGIGLGYIGPDDVEMQSSNITFLIMTYSTAVAVVLKNIIDGQQATMILDNLVSTGQEINVGFSYDIDRGVASIFYNGNAQNFTVGPDNSYDFEIEDINNFAATPFNCFIISGYPDISNGDRDIANIFADDSFNDFTLLDTIQRFTRFDKTSKQLGHNMIHSGLPIYGLTGDDTVAEWKAGIMRGKCAGPMYIENSAGIT